MSPIITSRPADGIAGITLNRPEAMNSISSAMASELAQACAELAAAPEVRVVVFGAAGERAFCAGADLKERAGMTDADIMRQRHAIRAVFGALLALPQPVIAAVHGFALGGGCELALSCDLVVADETATFGLPEVTVGLVPGGGGTQLALRRLGPGRAADLVLTGRKVGIDEAERIGLVDRPGAGRPARPGGAGAGRADRGQLPGGGPGGQTRHQARLGRLAGGRAGHRGRRLADRRAVRGPAGGHRRVRGEAQAGLAWAVSQARSVT